MQHAVRCIKLHIRWHALCQLQHRQIRAALKYDAIIIWHNFCWKNVDGSTAETSKKMQPRNVLINSVDMRNDEPNLIKRARTAGRPSRLQVHE